VVRLAHDDDHLTITVVDDGRGVASGFDLEQATGLGLSIVRTLVTTELAGTIEMNPASADDLASAGLDSAAGARGTVVRLRVPTAEE
jgi:two-component sensor histidine kinase